MSKTKRRPLQNPNVQGCLVLSLVVVIAAIFFLSNRQPTANIARPALLPSPTTKPLEEWQVSLQEELAALPSPTPSQTASPTLFIPPTQALPTQAIVVVTQPNTVDVSNLPTFTPIPPELVSPSPDFINATAVPLPDGVSVAAFAPALEENPEKYQLPPEQIPLSVHPFDHYYLARPIDVTANSAYLFYYPYGSSGSQGWRVHHGLDIPNPVGEEVRAAGGGTVIFAGSSSDVEEVLQEDGLEVYAAYGNLVVIQHDFGWRGQPVWTLYAHLSAATVQQGQRVTMGDIIGLVGVTGDVTGPHVHFEVRVGRNSYYSTRNPILWMAPYIGHGVVAGRVTDADGRFIENVLVQLNRAGRVTDTTTTYINPYAPNKRLWTVVPDDNWNENFVMGDIPAGEYQLVAVVDDKRYFQDVTINAGTTTFVEIRIGVVSTPRAVDATAIVPSPAPSALPTATP